MAVTKCKFIHDGRSGDSKGVDDTRDTLRWRIVTDNKYDTAQTIYPPLAASGLLPKQFEPHPANIFLTCRSVRIDNQADSPYHWTATAEYSSAPIKESDKEKQEKPNPVDRRAKIRWSTTNYQHVFVEDINGKAVVNSAGDYFAEQPEVERSYWRASITKNLTAIPTWVLDLDNPVNESQFSIQGLQVPPETGRLCNLAVGDREIENGFEYYPLSFDIEFRKNGWKIKPLDQGFRFINLDTGELENITDANGDPITSPHLLDGLGQKLANPSPDTAVFLEFDGYELFDFNNLPLA